MMATEAPSEMMRYGTMLQWLMENGLTEYEITRMIAKGVIRCRHHAGGRAWYYASQIKRDVLNGEFHDDKTPKEEDNKL